MNPAHQFSTKEENPSAEGAKEVSIADIHIIPDLQLRPRLNASVVLSYKILLQSGTRKLPPILLFNVNRKLFLVDGSHRLAAHKDAGLNTVLAETRVGDLDGAFIAAIKANAAHGLRLSNADKKQIADLAVKRFTALSDRAIAERCGLSPNFIGKARKRQAFDSPAHNAQVPRKGLDGKQYKAFSKKTRRRRFNLQKKVSGEIVKLRDLIFPLSRIDPKVARTVMFLLRQFADVIDRSLKETSPTPTPARSSEQPKESV